MELVLNTFGTSLNRDNEAFVVSNKKGRQRVPVDGVTSIQIGRGVQVTSDAVLLAIEHEIDVLFMDRGGMPEGRVWSPRYGSISTIRKGQIKFLADRAALQWIKQIVSEKISNQQALLLMMDGGDREALLMRDRVIYRLDRFREKVEAADGYSVVECAPQLRGWEGAASKAYFDAYSAFLPEDFRFSCRSQHPALDPVNALLNYGYGILYGQIEGELIKTGIDPYVGVLHRDNYNRPVLVYDVIERYRIWIDFVVAHLVCQRVVTDDLYSVQADGSCWLEILGRRVLIQSVNDYLDEVVDIGGIARSRAVHIMLYCQRLAQKFKQYL